MRRGVAGGWWRRDEMKGDCRRKFWDHSLSNRSLEHELNRLRALVIEHRATFREHGMAISALKLDGDAIDVETTDIALRVVLADGRELSAPLDWFPRLRDATKAQRSD